MTENTIKLKIHEEADLFSAFDPEQKILSEDVTVYFLNCFISTHKRDRERYTIEIQSDTPLDQESIKTKIHEFFCLQKDIINRGLRRLSLKAIGFAVFGIILLGLVLFLSEDSSNLNLEVLSTISSVALWEATNIVIIDSYEIRRTKRNYNKLVKAEIVITD